jgi:serine phosphatase RsbU (regulator of sigma subunit)
MDRLLAAVQRHREEAAETLAGSVFRDLDDNEHSDDMCLVALQLTALG